VAVLPGTIPEGNPQITQITQITKTGTRKEACPPLWTWFSPLALYFRSLTFYQSV